MNWINILHIYQPPTQEPVILQQAVEQSYLPLIDFLNKNPHYKITLNICGCLTEMLAKNCHDEILQSLQKLAQRKQIEFTGTAAYHTFLPLLPKEEIVYQIKENENINHKYLGEEYQPVGFFLPELAYGLHVAKIIHELGYKWIILDEIAYPNSQVDFNKIYQIKNLGLDVIFRNKKISNTYVPSTINKLMMGKQIPTNVITATDGELYGHRHQDIDSDLDKIISDKKNNFLTVTEFIQANKEREQIQPLNSSWESSKKDLQNNCPYHLWHHKNNKIHKYLWKLANMAIESVHQHPKDIENYWARHHLNQGLSSCTFWWASAQDLSEKFGPITWHPDMIERGVDELIRSMRSLVSLDKKVKLKAEKLRLKIKKLIWTKHWKVHA